MIYHGSAFYEPTLGHLFFYFLKCTKQKVMKFTHVCVGCVAHVSVCELMHCYITLYSLRLSPTFYVVFFLEKEIRFVIWKNEKKNAKQVTIASVEW